MEPPNAFVEQKLQGECPAELALRVMQGRWMLAILRELLIGVRRFSDLSRALVGVSAKLLTQPWRELEADGVLERIVYPEVPPKVESRLLARGWDLLPVLRSLHAWGGDGLQAGRPDAEPSHP